MLTYLQYTVRYLTVYLCQVSRQWILLDTQQFKVQLDALAPLPELAPCPAPPIQQNIRERETA